MTPEQERQLTRRVEELERQLKEHTSGHGCGGCLLFTALLAAAVAAGVWMDRWQKGKTDRKPFWVSDLVPHQEWKESN